MDSNSTSYRCVWIALWAGYAADLGGDVAASNEAWGAPDISALGMAIIHAIGAALPLVNPTP